MATTRIAKALVYFALAWLERRLKQHESNGVGRNERCAHEIDSWTKHIIVV